MKPSFLLPAVALILLGAGCSSPAPASTTPDTSAPIQANNTDKSAKQIEAEQALGIALPANSTILALVENKKAIGVAGTSSLSLSESTIFFTQELNTVGYEMPGKWNLVYENQASARFTGKGETWLIAISESGDTTTFDMQRQL